MKIGLLIAFIFWYGMLSLVYVAIPNDLQEGTIDYSFSDDLNTSGFTEDEISPDRGIFGFFDGISAILSTIGRFVGFVFFGFGLPDETPGYVSTFVVFWNSVVTALLIAWIISIAWDG